jgi:hypothetical protein
LCIITKDLAIDFFVFVFGTGFDFFTGSQFEFFCVVFGKGFFITSVHCSFTDTMGSLLNEQNLFAVAKFLGNGIDRYVVLSYFGRSAREQQDRTENGSG